MLVLVAVNHFCRVKMSGSVRSGFTPFVFTIEVKQDRKNGGTNSNGKDRYSVSNSGMVCQV